MGGRVIAIRMIRPPRRKGVMIHFLLGIVVGVAVTVALFAFAVGGFRQLLNVLLMRFLQPQ